MAAHKKSIDWEKVRQTITLTFLGAISLSAGVYIFTLMFPGGEATPPPVQSDYCQGWDKGAANSLARASQLGLPAIPQPPCNEAVVIRGLQAPTTAAETFCYGGLAGYITVATLHGQSDYTEEWAINQMVSCVANIDTVRNGP